MCRILSGQRYPEVSREQGVAWVVEAIYGAVARCGPARRHPGAGEPLQGRLWRYPEFAQKQDVFLEIVNAIR